MLNMKNHFSDINVPEITFKLLMIACAVVVIGCTSLIMNNSEKEAEQYTENDMTESSDITADLEKNEIPIVSTGTPNGSAPTTEYETTTEENEIEIKDTLEVPTPELTPSLKPVEPTRPYKYYYVNDNGWKAYCKEEWQDYLYEMCIKYDVVEYYEMFLAQMYHESAFRADIVSKTNDYGLMQINKCNHEFLKNKFGFTDFLDPYVSIESGVYFMSGFLHKYNDAEKALVCYNRGESAVKKGTYSTKYSKGVLADMQLLVELEE